MHEKYLNMWCAVSVIYISRGYKKLLYTYIEIEQYYKHI